MSSVPSSSSPSPIIPGPPATPPDTGAVSSPKVPISPPVRWEVDRINALISGLLARRGELAVKAEAGRIEHGRLKISNAPKAEQDLAESNLVKAEKFLRNTDAAIEGEFKLLYEALGGVGGDEKERKASADELPKAVKAAFEWEHNLRGKLEEEVMRAKLQKKGDLAGLSEAEANAAVKKALKNMNPNALEKLFASALEDVKKNAADKPLQGLGEIYLKAALPLGQRAKVVVRELNPAAKGAAGIGKAAAAGFAAIATRQKVTALGTSAHQVFLAGGAVLKKAHKRGAEEEHLFGQVSKFLGESAILESFHMTSATPSRVGASMISQKDRLRGISDVEIVKRDINIWGRLTPESAAELAKFIEEAASKLKKEKESKEVASGTKEAGKGIGVHYVPVLEGEGLLAYQKCEAHLWVLTTPDGKEILTTPDGKERVLTLPQVHQLVLEKGLIALDQVRLKPPEKRPGDPSRKELPLPLPLRKDLTDAVNVKWRAVLPSVTVPSVDAGGKLIKTPLLADFDTKVFVKDMVIMDDLVKMKPRVLNGILARLSPQAEHQMMLTLSLQTLDLHKGNIGFRPQSTPEYEALKDTPNFRNYQERYLAGEITDDEVRKINPELLKVLQGLWELVLFDTDRSFDESNVLIQRTYPDARGNKVIQHLIPLRSGLLEIPAIGGKPFTPEALALLKKEDANEANLRAWIRGDDRPIQRQLKRDPAFREKVQKYIQPFIDTQALGAYRKHDHMTVREKLVEDFALELNDLDKHHQFWKDLEDNVGYRAPKAGENLKDFAARNRIGVEKLLELNPKLKDLEGAIPPGVAVRIEDLTSLTPEAEKNRMKVAPQFFPRMTTWQQKALFDRKEAQRGYLNAYEEFRAFFADPSKVNFEENRAMLKKYIENPHAPFTSIEREDMLRELALKTPTDIQELRDFGAAIVEDTIPTYIAMAQAMYPLLADALALAKELYGSNAGEQIGYFRNNLEMQIAAARLHGKSPKAVALAGKLEAAIKKANEPDAEPPAFLK